MTEDEAQDHRMLAEIIGGRMPADVAPDEAHNYVLVFDWIASAIGAEVDLDDDDDDELAYALEADIIRCVNEALERLDEPPLLEADSDDHPFLPAKGLASHAADSVAWCMYLAPDCARTHDLLSKRWSDFTPDEMELATPLLRVLGQRRSQDALFQLML